MGGPPGAVHVVGGAAFGLLQGRTTRDAVSLGMAAAACTVVVDTAVPSSFEWDAVSEMAALCLASQVQIREACSQRR